MRQHFLVGIIRAAAGAPPPEHADYLIEFDPPTITIKYCPFCGANINHVNTPMRVATRLA